MTAQLSPDRPLVMHVVYSFAVGGLENGVVNLVNQMPASRWRHAIVALTEISETFRKRIMRDDVEYLMLRKPPGHAFGLYPTLWSLFRRSRPAIVHTRNLAALEAAAPAWAAGVPIRIHGEHGWGVDDIHGSVRRYVWLRRAFRPFVQHHVALSRHLEDYLARTVGIPGDRVTQIYNGVDTGRFRPEPSGRQPIAGSPFSAANLWLVGTVGRMEAVKDQATLARAFVRMTTLDRDAARRSRLVMIGDGELRRDVEAILDAGGVRHLAWLPGERDDVPDILRNLNCFVLPSLAEGISNTILEAMASALPVVATSVGGNAELVEDGLTGRLVPPADSEGLARAMLAYFRDPRTARRHGSAGRNRVERRFSLDRMVADYSRLYDQLLARKMAPRPGLGAA